jgi:hypothetical protein
MNEVPKLIEDNIIEKTDAEKTQEEIGALKHQLDIEKSSNHENIGGRIADILARVLLKCNEGAKRVQLVKNTLLGSISGIILGTAIQGIKIKEAHRDKVTEIEVEENIDGITSKHKEYKHEDPETTHIINALCGKEPFTEKEKLNIAIGITVKSCEDCKIPIPENIKNWDLQEVKNLYIQTTNSLYYPDELDIILSGSVYSDELYSVIWEQEKRSGSPYVKWSVTENTSEIGGAHNRAFYVTNTHTMYIKPEALTSSNITRQYVAEVSHALQYNEKTTISMIKSLCEDFTVSIVASQTGIDKRFVYDQILYDDPGTTEHEAHSIIEPTLQAEIDEAKKLYKANYQDSSATYYPSTNEAGHTEVDNDSAGVK